MATGTRISIAGAHPLTVFLNDAAATALVALSLHDALPISSGLLTTTTSGVGSTTTFGATTAGSMSVTSTGAVSQTGRKSTRGAAIHGAGSDGDLCVKTAADNLDGGGGGAGTGHHEHQYYPF